MKLDKRLVSLAKDGEKWRKFIAAMGNEMNTQLRAVLESPATESVENFGQRFVQEQEQHIADVCAEYRKKRARRKP